MSKFDENESVVYKRLAQEIIKELKPISLKLQAKIKKAVHAYNMIKNKFLSCSNLDELEFYSHKLKIWQDSINKSFAVLDRLDIIIERNESRIKFLQEKCDAMGIYNDKVESKTLQEMIIKEQKNITTDALNLNQYARGSGFSLFFDGEVLSFRDGKIDFKDNSTISVLKEASQEYIGKIINRFPFAVSSIPDEVFAHSSTKNKILKECIIYASNQSKGQSLKNINMALGNLLSKADKINSLEQFAQELKNLFNISAKKHLKQLLPNKAEEIDDKLRCNEQSEFLPPSKIQAVLANGIAGKEAIVTEEQVNEEVRKEQEQNDRLMLELDDLLNNLIDDAEEEIKEDERAVQEEVQRAEKQQIEANLELELQRELERVLKKDIPNG